MQRWNFMEFNLEGLDMQKWNISRDRAEKVDEKNGIIFLPSVTKYETNSSFHVK